MVSNVSIVLFPFAAATVFMNLESSRFRQENSPPIIHISQPKAQQRQKVEEERKLVIVVIDDDI